MSNARNRESDSWQVVLAELRRKETTWRGLPLSNQDHNTWTEALLLAMLVLSDLSNRFPGCGSTREHIQWCHNVVSIDVDQVAHFLPEVIDFLRHYSVGGSITYDRFKPYLRERYPFAGSFMAPVKRALELFFLDPSPDTLRAPYQFFSFLTHLSLSDLDMGPELEDEFLSNEERVSLHRTPDFIVASMKQIVESWFHGFKVDESNFHPHHGPGAVAGLRGANIEDKYDDLRPTHLQRLVFRRCAQVDLDSYRPRRSVGVTTDCSEVIFVPKSMKTQRVISKEPATFMYLQQGIKEVLYAWIGSHRSLSRHIDLRDQSGQRSRALLASSHRQMATVDLSAASDSVSWDLVKRVFHDTPLYPYLEVLRTKSVKLPSGKNLKVAKFAPMGSALCFPLESLIFAAIVECTVRYVYATTGTMCSDWGVFGDDIIIHDLCLADLVSNLHLCGFRINESKTFGGNLRFREACGCEAYDGVDVTPMRIGRRFSGRHIHTRSAALFDAHISMANAAEVMGFHTLRWYLVRKVLDSHRTPPLFSKDGRGGFYSPVPTNYRAERRYRLSYQREEIRVLRLTTVSSIRGHLRWCSKSRRYFVVAPNTPDETVRLFEWLRLSCAEMRAHLDPLDDRFVIQAQVGSTGTALSKRWIVIPGEVGREIESDFHLLT